MDTGTTPPAFETEPPFTSMFIAHLHAGYFDDHPDVDAVWRRVMTDPDAVAVLMGLETVDSLLDGLET